MRKYKFGKIIKGAGVLLLVISMGAALCGCTMQWLTGTAQHERTVYAMDTVMQLQFTGGSEKLMDAAENKILQLEDLLSTTEKNSEIFALNEKKAGSLSRDTTELLRFALQMGKETNGALDVSIFPVVRAWGFTTGEFRVPEEAELQELLNHVDYRRITLNAETGDAALTPKMMIDLGSVAKGYTGDALLSLLKEEGVTSALLDLGGNIQTLGSKPDGSDWTIAVQNPNPETSGDYLGLLSVSDKAVVTSGGYQRYFTGSDGTVYWHIIDPATGKPARSGLVSVTIVGAEGKYCDALSTSLFIMGAEKAEEFWRSHGDFDMILVTEEGEVLVTETIAGAFSLSDTEHYQLRVIPLEAVS